MNTTSRQGAPAINDTMAPAHRITPGMAVECPRRSSIGNHVATVTHATYVGSGAFRMVVTLDCGHDINLSGGHGLYVLDTCECCGRVHVSRSPGCESHLAAHRQIGGRR